MVMIYPHWKYLLQNRPLHLTTFVIVNGKNNGLTTNVLQEKHIFVYLVDFLPVFTPGLLPKANFSSEPLKIVCSQTKSVKKREKPSAFVKS